MYLNLYLMLILCMFWSKNEQHMVMPSHEIPKISSMSTTTLQSLCFFLYFVDCYTSFLFLLCFLCTCLLLQLSYCTCSHRFLSQLLENFLCYSSFGDTVLLFCINVTGKLQICLKEVVQMLSILLSF